MTGKTKKKPTMEVSVITIIRNVDVGENGDVPVNGPLGQRVGLIHAVPAYRPQS